MKEKTYKELKEMFGGSLADYPETTEIVTKSHTGNEESIFLPTKEIFQKGDWLARRFSGITFPLIEKALNRREFPMYNIKSFWVA